MKRMHIALMIGLIAGASSAQAQDDYKPEPGFVSLFNGKDLTGWYQKNKDKEDLTGKTESPNKKFTVEDGVIKVKGGGGGDLVTRKTFDADFEIRLEFRAALKADSGLFIRGTQLQVRDYPNAGPYKKLKNFKNADWNVLTVVVTGNVALCKCNDEVIEPKFKIGVKGGIGLQSESGNFEFRRIRVKMADADTPKQSAALDPGTSTVADGKPAKKRLLLVTESRGFKHSVVNRGKADTCLVERVFVDLAAKEKFFEVDFTQNARAVIEGDNLKKYDAVFFYTTGDLMLSDVQKSDLLAFVRSGKGFGGSHCATDTYYNWKEYGELIGGYFDGHPWHQKIRVIVEDKKHIATKHLGDSFEITDEIYQFKAPYSREKLKVLMRLDMDSVKNPGKRADKDNALAWTNQYGKGRVFYTALGHREDVWNDPRFQQHVIGGLRYMFGMDEK